MERNMIVDYYFESSWQKRKKEEQSDQQLPALQAVHVNATDPLMNN